MPDSHSNFVLAQYKDAKNIFDKLVEKNIYVRYFNLPGLEDKLRITVGTRAQDDKLIEALKGIL